MIDGLRARGILTGIRRGPQIDLSSLVQLLLSLFALDIKMPQIREMDINPVMASQRGCLAVEAAGWWWDEDCSHRS